MGGCNLGCPLKLAPPCLVETGSTEETPRLIPYPASPTIKENVTWVQGRYNITRGRDKIWLRSNGLQHSPRLFKVPHEGTSGMQSAPSSSSKNVSISSFKISPFPQIVFKKPRANASARRDRPAREYPWLFVYLEESINSSKTRPRARNSYEGEGQTDWRNCTFVSHTRIVRHKHTNGWMGWDGTRHSRVQRPCQKNAPCPPSLQRGKR